MAMAKKSEIRSEVLRIVGAIIIVIGFVFFEKKVATLDYKSTGSAFAAITIGVLIYLYTIMFLIAAITIVSEILMKENEKKAKKAGIASIGMLILFAIATQFLFWGIVISYRLLLFIAITLIVVASVVFVFLLLKVFR